MSRQNYLGDILGLVINREAKENGCRAEVFDRTYLVNGPTPIFFLSSEQKPKGTLQCGIEIVGDM